MEVFEAATKLPLQTAQAVLFLPWRPREAPGPHVRAQVYPLPFFRSVKTVDLVAVLTLQTACVNEIQVHVKEAIRSVGCSTHACVPASVHLSLTLCNCTRKMHLWRSCGHSGSH